MKTLLNYAWRILTGTDWIKVFLENWQKLIPVAGLIGIFATILTHLDEIHVMLNNIASIGSSASWSMIADIYAKINKTAPLTEAIGVMSALASLKVVTILTRWTKAAISNAVIGS